MAAADLSAWRKLNSDPMTVDMVMTDGSTMRAIVMIPREKGLRDVFNVTDTFLEVECLENGPIVFQREALRSVRPAGLPKAEQLDKRVLAAEKLNAHQMLGVPKSASVEMILAAADGMRDKYDPARAVAANMPDEVVLFMTSMCRRVDAAQAAMAAAAETVRKPAA